MSHKCPIKQVSNANPVTIQHFIAIIYVNWFPSVIDRHTYMHTRTSLDWCSSTTLNPYSGDHQFKSWAGHQSSRLNLSNSPCDLRLTTNLCLSVGWSCVQRRAGRCLSIYILVSIGRTTGWQHRWEWGQLLAPVQKPAFTIQIIIKKKIGVKSAISSHVFWVVTLQFTEGHTASSC
jgi:hypothetical protein